MSEGSFRSIVAGEFGPVQVQALEFAVTKANQVFYDEGSGKERGVAYSQDGNNVLVWYRDPRDLFFLGQVYNSFYQSMVRT